LDKLQLELLMQGLPNVVVLPTPKPKPANTARPGTPHPVRRALDQPVRLSKGFVHTLAGGQDHPNQGVHASGVGQGQNEGENACSGCLKLSISKNKQIDENNFETSRTGHAYELAAVVLLCGRKSGSPRASR
jgi:hypothetical protein